MNGTKDIVCCLEKLISIQKTRLSTFGNFLGTRAILKFKFFLDLEIWSQINLSLYMIEGFAIISGQLDRTNIESILYIHKREKKKTKSILLCVDHKKTLLFLKAGFFFRRYYGARHISKLLCVIHELFYVLWGKV